MRDSGHPSFQFFRKYLTPDERADVFIVALEALVSSRSADICAASRMLKMILKDSLPEIGKVGLSSRGPSTPWGR